MEPNGILPDTSYEHEQILAREQRVDQKNEKNSLRKNG